MGIVLVDATIRREWMDLKVGDVIKMKNHIRAEQMRGSLDV